MARRVNDTDKKIKQIEKVRIAQFKDNDVYEVNKRIERLEAKVALINSNDSNRIRKFFLSLSRFFGGIMVNNSEGMENPFQAQCLTIDVNKKNLLIISLPEDTKLEAENELLAILEERIADWIAQPEQPVFILAHNSGIEVKLEKAKNVSTGEQSAEDLLKRLADEVIRNDACYVLDSNFGTQRLYCFFCGKEKPGHTSGCVFIEITNLCQNIP